MALWKKILFKSGGFLTQAADALIWPDQAGYGSDVVRPLDEAVGDPGYLRKLHVTWTRSSAAGTAEDVALCTFHFAKLSGEDATNAWLAADMAAIEARMDTFWTAVKPNAMASTILASYRWYKAGPAFPLAGPAIRITSRSVAGTSAASQAVPPQCSVNVSEHTRLRKHWGRFYLPSFGASSFNTYGRSAVTAGISAAADAMYDGFLTDGTPAVVFSKAKPERPKKHGGTLPAAPARAFAVESIVVDDVADVIRSRRFDRPTSRIETPVG